jgi:4-hydroxy-tetrahydrodipicolinate synthase
VTLDRLWVPLLTHYRQGAETVDFQRMSAHVRHLRPHVSQFLIAGSTGDGWDMAEGMLADLAAFSADPVFEGCTLAYGALAATTAEVVRRAGLIEAARPDPRSDVLVVCPPVGGGIGQEEMLAHFRTVIDNTRSSIAIYELPQVTGCSLDPETVRLLASDPRVKFFKDSSGDDRIIGYPIPGVTMLRGAEGGYFEAVTRGPAYDGWLLSTGNIVAPSLREIERAIDAGNLGAAQRLSGALSALIAAAFEAVSAFPHGNAFSNVNRGVDHLLAFGDRHRDVEPPLTISGVRLPVDMIGELDALFARLPSRSRGYLNG